MKPLKNKTFKKGLKEKEKGKKKRNKTIKKGLKEKRLKPVLKNNFYHYVNNDWVTHTYISKDTLNKTTFSILQKKVDNQLLNCVQKYLIKESRQCKALYVSAVNWNDELREPNVFIYKTI
jgi:predicted metalloendopeptidase